MGILHLPPCATKLVEEHPRPQEKLLILKKANCCPKQAKGSPERTLPTSRTMLRMIMRSMCDHLPGTCLMMLVRQIARVSQHRSCLRNIMPMFAMATYTDMNFFLWSNLRGSPGTVSSKYTTKPQGFAMLDGSRWCNSRKTSPNSGQSEDMTSKSLPKLQKSQAKSVPSSSRMILVSADRLNTSSTASRILRRLTETSSNDRRSRIRSSTLSNLVAGIPSSVKPCRSTCLCPLASLANRRFILWMGSVRSLSQAGDKPQHDEDLHGNRNESIATSIATRSSSLSPPSPPDHSPSQVPSPTPYLTPKWSRTLSPSLPPLYSLATDSAQCVLQ